MRGQRKWSEIRGPRTPEQEARLAAGVAATRTILHLAELRAARGLTQDGVSEAMAVSQAHVSQIEHKDDLYLSTLLGYVHALGGEAHLRVVFPDHEEFDLPLERRIG
jgi:DNA-binding XRE family transcriptional regulator